MILLAVDDERLSLQRLERSIREVVPQATVYAFRNPQEALYCAEQHPIDVAFLDIELNSELHGVKLAMYLKEINPDINLIFTTGYSEYMRDAFALHANGYIMKPVTGGKVLRELQNLRNPVIQRPNKQLMVQCFGDFEVFFDEKPVVFHYRKTKELFAYLVDRKGASVTGNAICSVLWEENSGNKATKAYLRNIFLDLKNTFEEIGVGNVLIKGWNTYAVKKDAFWCDYYEFEKGNVTAINSFHNEYMSQYSWAEFRLGEIVKNG